MTHKNKVTDLSLYRDNKNRNKPQQVQRINYIKTLSTIERIRMLSETLSDEDLRRRLLSACDDGALKLFRTGL